MIKLGKLKDSQNKKGNKMRKPIRGMENVVIGKYYETVNKNYGSMYHGILRYIVYDVTPYGIKPFLYFDHGQIYASDCAVIPYSPCNFNKYNTLYLIENPTN